VDIGALDRKINTSTSVFVAHGGLHLFILIVRLFGCT